MRNVLILILLCFSLTMSGTTYYVDQSGNDSNSGSSSSPWKTLAYACSKATSSADIIHINGGTYTETSQCNLAAGVSIEGVGTSSIIKSHYTAGSLDNGLIQLSGGTNTGQHISGIYVTGDGNGNSAIVVNGRSNVTILNCTLTNFGMQGIRFTGSSACTGNSIHDCNISGCSGYDPNFGSNANVYLNYQTGFLFFNNKNDNTTNAINGDGMRVWNYVNGLKIYNNTLTGPENATSGGNYAFTIEVWGTDKSSLGHGMEIYGNTILGTVDFSSCEKGTYSFGIDYHNNLHGNSSTASIPTSAANSNSKYLLEFEETMNDIIIRNNTFRNTDRPIYFDSNGTSPGGVNNVKIYSNLFQNIYYNYQCQSVDAGYVGQGCGILFGGSASPASQSNIYIQNNTFVAWTGSVGAAQLGVLLPTSNTCSNIYIQNNIFKGFSVAPYAAYGYGSGSISNLYLQKNVLYNNGNTNNVLYTGITPTPVTNDGGIKSDPLFISSTDFHLQAGSPAIGSGVSISGLTTDYEGNTIKNPPSIGAFESTSTATAPTPPVYQSSVIQNTTSSLLEITYDLTLNNAVVPAASSFSVLVNTVSRTVNSVTISGNKVQLTLASAIVFGDVVNVTYNKPSGNPLQSSSGGQAVTINAQLVTNNVTAVNLGYISSSVENATPSILEMSYSLTLATVVPAVSSFIVKVNSVNRTVNAVAASGTKVKLTLSSRILPGDAVTVSYTKPATNPIQTASGGTASSISNQQVTNNCINTAPTAAITSPLTNSSFSATTNITITASAADADGSVTLVEFYYGSTKLGSKSSAPYTYAWNGVTAGNYSLTVIATDNLKAKTTSSSVSISVVNSAPNPNQHPIVKILNPSKGIKFDKLSPVSIDAIASDPDGSVAKVEFYNGSQKLVELTSAPYTYTWKDVVAGKYSITAVATDNLNDTTISSPVEFEVGTPVKYDVNSEIVKLYPNPNNGNFSIELINPLQSDKSEIIITDLAGKQVFNGPILKEETSKKFDLSGSRSGIYVMMIKDKEILVTKKFIKN